MWWLVWVFMIDVYLQFSIIHITYPSEILGVTKPSPPKNWKILPFEKPTSYSSILEASKQYLFCFQTWKLPVKSAANFLHSFSFWFVYTKVSGSTSTSTSFRGDTKAFYNMITFNLFSCAVKLNSNLKPLSQPSSSTASCFNISTANKLWQN